MFEVKKERCNECLYSENKVVSSARRRQILSDCKRNDSHFSCHKGTIEGKDVCCAGFYASQSTNLSRVAQRLGAVKLVD